MNFQFQMPSAKEICEKFPCKPEVKTLAQKFAKPADFVSALRQENMSPDAVQALARSMPKEKAVEWASKSARMAGEKAGLSEGEQKALDAAEAWVSNPDTAEAAAAAAAAAGLPADSPACWASNAAAFAEGVQVPEEAGALDAGDDLTAHFSASSVLLAAAKMAGVEMPETAEMPEAPVFPEGLSAEDVLAKGAELLLESPEPLDMAPEQLAETARLLEPFLDLGVKIAQTVPDWL